MHHEYSTASNTSSTSSLSSVVIDIQQIILHDNTESDTHNGGNSSSSSSSNRKRRANAADSLIAELLRLLQAHQQRQLQFQPCYFVKPLVMNSCYELNQFLPSSLCRDVLLQVMLVKEQQQQNGCAERAQDVHVSNGNQLKKSCSSRNVFQSSDVNSDIINASIQTRKKQQKHDSGNGRKRSSSISSAVSSSSNGSITPRSRRHWTELFSSFSLKRTKSSAGITASAVPPSPTRTPPPIQRSRSEYGIKRPQFDGTPQNAMAGRRLQHPSSLRYLYPLHTVKVDGRDGSQLPRDNISMQQLDTLLHEAINATLIPILESCPLESVGNEPISPLHSRILIRRAYVWRKQMRGHDISTSSVVHREAVPSVKDKLVQLHSTLRKKGGDEDREGHVTSEEKDDKTSDLQQSLVDSKGDASRKRAFVANICLGSVHQVQGKRAIAQIKFNSGQDTQEIKSLQSAGMCYLYDANSINVVYPDSANEWLFQCIFELEVVDTTSVEEDHTYPEGVNEEDARCCIS